MKAVVVFDLPDGISLEDIECNTEIMLKKPFDDWFTYSDTIQLLPEKKIGDDLYERYGSWTLSDEKEASYRLGWNDCLYEITGEEK